MTFEPRIITKICKQCDQPYGIELRRSADSKYCSPECKKIVEVEKYKKNYNSSKTGAGPQKKHCTWCGNYFEVEENLRGKGQYMKCPECRKLGRNPLPKCTQCGNIIVSITSEHRTYCIECERDLVHFLIEHNIPRVAHVRYRFCQKCKKVFYDDGPSKNARRQLCPKCKEFLENKYKKDYPLRVCDYCSNEFKPRAYNQNYCSGCSKKFEQEQRQKKRHKTCQLCGKPFYDISYSATQQICDSCDLKEAEKILCILQQYQRPSKARYALEFLSNHVSHIKKDRKYYGRIGEVLFLCLFPDAHDMNIDRRDNYPYDMEHEIFGKVDVKTSLPAIANEMKSWSFADPHKACDYLFCIGFSRDHQKVEKLWSIPKKVLTPGKGNIVAYDTNTNQDPTLIRFSKYEVTRLFDLISLNDYLQKLLTLKIEWAYDLRKLKYMSSIWRGRLGELIFYQLHPNAKDMLVEQGIDAPYDFEDPVLGKVDVKTGAAANEGYWQLKNRKFDKENEADCYFYVAMSRDYKEIKGLFLIKAPLTERSYKLDLKSPYNVTKQYDLSNINLRDLRKGRWKPPNKTPHPPKGTTP